MASRSLTLLALLLAATSCAQAQPAPQCETAPAPQARVNTSLTGQFSLSCPVSCGVSCQNGALLPRRLGFSYAVR